MMLTLKYGDILSAAPTNLERVERVSKRFEEVKQFGGTLLELCRELSAKMSGVCEVYDKLQSTLEGTPLFSEEERWFRSTCQKSAAVLQEMSCVFDDYRTQLTQGVVEPLAQFISKDLEKVGAQKKVYENAVEEHEQAMVRFSRVSKKKESEKTRFEAQADLYTATKKYHENAVRYYSEVNLFRYSHLGGMATTMMELVRMQGTAFSRASICASELDKTTLLIQPHIWRLQSSSVLVKVAVERQKERRLQEFPLTYTPDPDPSDPFIEFQPVDQALRRKAGYVFLRSQRQGAVGVGFRWDRQYCYTRRGRLLIYKGANKTPEVLLPLLNSTCSSIEVDDRRYTFQCVRGTKTVVLQAMSERDRDEWLTTIGNLSVPESSSLAVAAKSPQKAGGSEGGKKVVEERNKIKMWISRELSSKKQSKGASRSEEYTYSARFLGSTLLEEGKSHAVFSAALKKAVADQEDMCIDYATSRVSIRMTLDGISCYDAVDQEFLSLPWTKLAYCGYVPENDKLFGFVFPASDQQKQKQPQQHRKQLFTCLMYETEGSGKAVWMACNALIKVAHEKRQQQKQMQSMNMKKQKDTSLQRSDSVQSLLSDISDDA